MHPTVVNLESQKHAAGAKHAVDLGKHTVLKFAGAKMMKYQNSDGRGKAVIGEGESGSVTTEGAARAAIVVRLQMQGRFGIVIERGDAADGLAELRRSRAVARANFEDMVAERRTRQDPRKQLPLSEEAPGPGRTEEVLKPVHGL